MEFTVKTIIPVSCQDVYTAWLDSDGHSNMTGGAAEASNEIGASFMAWDGYISGKNIALDPHNRIVQSWRTTEFSENEEDSQIEILFDEVDGQCAITLIHTNLPSHGEQYKSGWVEHYFEPMKVYFEGN